MWEMLDARAVGYREGAPAPRATSSGAASSTAAHASSSTDAASEGVAAPVSTAAPLRSELRGNALRQALSCATRASDLNVVTHPGQSEAQSRRLRSQEDAKNYVQENLQVRNALFLVRLEQREGEFPLGLAVRTFDAAEDDVNNGKIQVRWYVRKASANSWGSQPAFKYATVFNNRRQGRPWLSVIEVSNIVPIPIVITRASVRSAGAEPKLSDDCMAMVREYKKRLAETEEWVRDEQCSASCLEAKKASGLASGKQKKQTAASSSDESDPLDSSDSSSEELRPRLNTKRSVAERKRRRSAKS
eukprot:6206862-Pleurochrysis_carterae.AAC.1